MIPFLARWQSLMPIALALLIAAAFFWQRQIIDHLRGKITVAETRADALEGHARAQNEAVAHWQQAAQLAAARIRETQLAAAQTSMDTQARAQATLTMEVPSDCGEAAGWAIDRAADLTYAWSHP